MWSQTWTDDDNYIDGELGVLQQLLSFEGAFSSGCLFSGHPFLVTLLFILFSVALINLYAKPFLVMGCLPERLDSLSNLLED
jgi:hypothetical protein